jgi:uncharacterized membrane protein
MSLGIAFVTLGVTFFFAYNWADLHGFVKIGIVQGFLIALLFGIFFAKISDLTRHIFLTATCMMVGVLFAVFGQVYQTGANAFDFFLAWAVFTAIWVVISNFPPLWLLYIALLNVVLMTYLDQVAVSMLPNFAVLCYLALNLPFLLLALYYTDRKDNVKVPRWFTYSLVLWVAVMLTFTLAINIAEKTEEGFVPLFILWVILSGLAIAHTFRVKQPFYLAIVPLSFTILGCAFFIHISSGEAMLLSLSIFTVIAITLTIKNIFHYQNKWSNEINN